MSCQFRTFTLLIAAIICLSCANGLYEDQAGKFDWHQKYFGRIRFIVNDLNQPKRIIVGTEDNIVGAINSVTGAVLYRNLFEATGHLYYLGNYQDKSILAISAQDNKVKVRTFTASNGIAQNEWILKEDLTHATEFNSQLYFVNVKTFPRIRISKFALQDVKDSDINVPSKHKEIKLELENANICEIASPYFVCAQGKSISIIHLEHGTVLNKKIDDGVITELSVTGSSQLSAVAVKGAGFVKVYAIKQNSKMEPELEQFPCPSKAHFVTLSQTQATKGKSDSILFITKLETAHLINMEAYNNKMEQLASHSLQIKTSLLIPSLQLTKGFCVNSQCGIVGFTKDELLFGTKIDNKNVVQLDWSRQESLANTLSVEMVDYPSDLEATWNPYSEHSFVAGFIARLKYQIEGIVSGGRLYSNDQDRFGLRKVIVFVTSVGKVLGMDTTTGQIIYSFILPEFGVFGDASVNLYIQRSAKYSPLKSLATVVYKSSKSGSTILFPFNPVEGNHLDEPQTFPPIIQSQMLIHGAESINFLKPILLLDSNLVVHTYPSNVPEVKSTYFFMAEKGNGNPVLRGYAIKPNLANNKLEAKLTWDLKFGSSELLGIYGKLPEEVIQSQGKVLPDRSVSYKYMNPNLVVVVTFDPEVGNINIFLVDAVSGTIIHSFWHKKCRGPVHVVHSEHWMVYSLYNEKSRRFEVTSVELYEGQSQSNSTTFSSFAAPPVQPIIVKQSYIFPTGINVLSHTRTAKGITNKDILIALPNGGILELPRIILQPRLSQSQFVHQVQDEDGVIHSVPYIPELPIPTDMIINYNQSVKNVRGIKAWPTKLESTCLILVYGNDLFFTKVAPSKTFDVLKDDFDHWFITIVLIGLCTATYVTKKLAQRKHLEQLWR